MQYWASDGARVTNQQNLPMSLGSSSTFGAGAQTDRALGAQTVIAAGTSRAPIRFMSGARAITNVIGNGVATLVISRCRVRGILCNPLEHSLKQYLAKKPDATLAEVIEAIGKPVHPSTASRTLRRLNLPRKKSRPVPPNRTAPT